MLTKSTLLLPLLCHFFVVGVLGVWSMYGPMLLLPFSFYVLLLLSKKYNNDVVHPFKSCFRNPLSLGYCTNIRIEILRTMALKFHNFFIVKHTHTHTHKWTATNTKVSENQDHLPHGWKTTYAYCTLIVYFTNSCIFL